MPRKSKPKIRAAKRVRAKTPVTVPVRTPGKRARTTAPPQGVPATMAPPARDLKDPGQGPCKFCQKPVGPEMFCFGCKTHICDGCDVNPDMPWGQHAPELHRTTNIDEL